MDHLNAAEKKLLHELKDKGEKEEDVDNAEAAEAAEAEDSGGEKSSGLKEQQTHNGIF